jgi:polar amino acid transport system substrate-binding protein
MKKRTFNILTLLLLFVFSLSIFSGCTKKSIATKDEFSKLKDKGYVVVGLDDTFAPMGFRDDKGNIVGFDVVEISPPYERGDNTSILGAKIIREALLAY